MITRRRIDGLLAVGIVGLVLFGTVMIYSASVVVAYTNHGDPQYFFRRQIVAALLGFFMLALGASLDYHTWQRQAKWTFLATFLLLLSVFVMSRGAINGAHRWIDIAGQSFQPSEAAKVTFLMYISAWFVQRRSQIADFSHTFFPFLGILVAVSVLMLLEPDFGTLSVILVAALAVYFVAGMTWKQIGVGLICLVVGLSIVLAAPYRRARLNAYFNPQEDTSGVAYQVKNISIAIGSGGWWGLGFGQSGQKRLFLPEPQSDSIFAIIVEELGYLVSSFVVLVLGFVVYRGYRVAARADDEYGRLLAVGITTWFGYQAFLNLLAMLQLVPLKGVPLPFISYGGTNLVFSLFAAGVLLNISRYTSDRREEETPVPRVTKRRRR